MFYKVDSTRMALREFAWSTPMPLWPVVLPIVAVLKLLRIRLPVPAVVPDSLEPYRVEPTDIPEEVRAKLQPLEDQMRDNGFVDPAYFWVCDPYGSRRVCHALFRHSSGIALGMISFRQEGAGRRPKEVLYPALLTAWQDGSVLESTAGRPEMLSPPETIVQRLAGASVAELWRLHGERISAESAETELVSLPSQDAAEALLHAMYRIECGFHLRRGVLVPRNEIEQQEIEGVMGAPGDEDDKAFAAVYGEIQRLANRKASWTSGLLILLATAGIFLATGIQGIPWRPLLLVVGVLFVHELGHFAAMSAFGYRNLRMFFIPFLGAAVTGQHYNVAGWKKAIVSLAGPVPGIVLGALIAVLAPSHWPTAYFAAIALIGINAFNLLPIMPLDGGQLMHAVLFSRHPALDVAFRALAAGLLLLSGLLGMWILPVLGLLMLLGLPLIYRVGKVVRRLRTRGFDATSPDGHTIPLETARQIHEELRQVLPARPNARTSAQLTLQSFELLNARPPGWLGSAALIGLHGLSLLVAVVALVGLMFPWLWRFPRSMGQERELPRHALSLDVLAWEGSDAARVGHKTVNTIVANFASRQEARKWYEAHTAGLPSQAVAVLFGQTLLVALPAANHEARERWFNELDTCCESVAVHAAKFNWPCALSCQAPTAEVAERLAHEAETYTSTPYAAYLVPPWSPEQRLSDADRKGRETFLAFRRRGPSYGSDPRWTALEKGIRSASRRGDVRALDRLTNERERLVEELDREKFRRMREESGGKWDGALMDILEKFPEPRPPLSSYEGEAGVIDGSEAAAASVAHQKETEGWWVRLGSRLGQLPLDGKAPIPGADRFSTSWGAVVRKDRTIRFDMAWNQPAFGAPALLEWLAQEGCEDFRYEFRLAAADDNDDW